MKLIKRTAPKKPDANTSNIITTLSEKVNTIEKNNASMQEALLYSILK